MSESFQEPEDEDEAVPFDDSAPEAPGADRATDHELIRRAQEQDEDAFRLLVERYQERAVRVALNLISNREDARDLTQEAFVRVFRNLHRFDFQHEFPTWLFRIVTNLAIDHLRKRRPTWSTQGPGPGEDGEESFLDLPDAEAGHGHAMRSPS